MIKPRLAVGFHFYNDFDTAPEMESEIRRHYKGRLALAKDLMVINVTAELIVTRMAVTSSHVWPSRPDKGKAFQEAARKPRPVMSSWLAEKQIFPK